jgi:hypothetical protein
VYDGTGGIINTGGSSGGNGSGGGAGQTWSEYVTDGKNWYYVYGESGGGGGGAGGNGGNAGNLTLYAQFVVAAGTWPTRAAAQAPAAPAAR